MKHIFLIALAVLSLSACNSELDDVSQYQREELSKTQDLYYSYPMDGQQDISPNSPIVLAFMVPPEAQAADFVLNYQDAQGQSQQILFDDSSLAQVNNSLGVVLTPKEPLPTATTFTLKLTSSKVNFPSQGLSFTTRPAFKGAIESQITRADFELNSLSPDGAQLPFTDFSSINLSFSQPLNLASVNKANIKLAQNGQSLDLTLLAKGRMLTIDPVNDFAPGQPVSLSIKGLTSTLGETLSDYSKTFTPLNTQPRETQVLEVMPASDCKDSQDRSALTGMIYNCIPVLAKLVGDDAQDPATISSQSGNIYAELAYTPNFPNTTPLRVKKGAVLTGSGMRVLIGGKVYAGFNSGPVTATFISDANGYLLDNPYSNDPNAPKRMIMTTDLAFDTAGAKALGTAESRANGAFTQKMMHVTMVGTAKVDVSTGRLIADAVSVVELNVLGQDQGYGVLSFHMESYADQANAPAQEGDTRPLEISSWLPGATVNTVRPGDPIILLFNKPLAPNSVAKAVNNGDLSLRLNGANQVFGWRLEGTSIVIEPVGGLSYSSADIPSDYTVHLGASLTDVSGQQSMTSTDLSFTVPVYATSAGTAPIINTLYPGFPCVTQGLNLDNKEMGKCKSTPKDGSTGIANDILPITSLPANRSIYVTFSQVMAASSINNNTFKVEQCESLTSCDNASAIAGKLEPKARELVFTPNEPWQDGKLYRYTLFTGNKSVCASNTILCSKLGWPLHTNLLSAPDGDKGGENLVVYFYGSPASDSVLQRLRNFPTADIDASFSHEAAEPQPVFDANGELTNPEILMNSTKLTLDSVDGLLITKGNIGCDIGQSCPEKAFIYMTSQLNTEVLGYQSPEQIQARIDVGEFSADLVPDLLKQNGVITKGAVLVHILPSQLVTSSLTTFAKVMGISTLEVATGAQVMRIRYQEDSNNVRRLPVTGWIVETSIGPQFITQLDLLFDAPYMGKVSLGFQNNLHSYNLDNIKLAGALTFLPDGRLQIKQLSEEQTHISIHVGGTMNIAIPEGGINLNYIGVPVTN